MSDTQSVKILDTRCEMGQCGGRITLITDGTNAYAYVEPHGHGYIEQDCEYIVRNVDGSVAVSCGAVHPDREERCDGVGVFGSETIRFTPVTESPLASRMSRMEQGE